MNIKAAVLNKYLEDIIVTGYTENDGDKYIYNPMLWWIYLKIEESYVVLTSEDGTMTIGKTKKIECNFEIDGDDLFTISSISKSDFGKICQIDLFYDTSDNLIGFGINIIENPKYIFINSLNYDGLVIELTKKRSECMETIAFTKLVIVQ